MLFANLKMNKTKEEMEDYFSFFNKNLPGEGVVFIPSFPFLSMDKGDLIFGAQNISTYEEGSYTGEVSGKQLKSLGVQYVVIGHSERRKYYSAEDKEIPDKVVMAINNGIIPIICVGENKEQRDMKKTSEVVKRQLLSAFEKVDKEDLVDVIVAYEPVWSIGTGVIPTNDEIEELVVFIKKIIFNKYKKDINVLYGGSVNPRNIDTLKKIPNIFGYLVGTAAKDKNEFLELIRKEK